jgi:hypothetical protein
MLTWTEVEARIERAREALETGQYTIRKVEGLPTAEAVKAIATFAVRNGSDDGDPYTVCFYETCRTGKCTCPDFEQREGSACKHVAMTVLHEWPDRFKAWADKVRELCAPEPEAETEPRVPAEQLQAAVKQAVHEALLHLEEQITAALAPEIERITLGILADGQHKTT